MTTKTFKQYLEDTYEKFPTYKDLLDYARDIIVKPVENTGEIPLPDNLEDTRFLLAVWVRYNSIISTLQEEEHKKQMQQTQQPLPKTRQTGVH